MATVKESEFSTSTWKAVMEARHRRVLEQMFADVRYQVINKIRSEKSRLVAVTVFNALQDRAVERFGVEPVPVSVWKAR